MRTALSAATLVVLAGALVGASTQRDVVVSADGRVGAFRVDRTPEADIRRVAGRPASVQNFVTAGGGRGRSLTYRCGSGCETAYFVNRRTGKLSDFSGNSRRLVTPRGTRVGTTRREAEAREGVRVGRGCLVAISLRTRRAFLDLELAHGRVAVFHLSGRHSVVDC